MKARTLREALQLVPEHIMLRPGEAKPGDEWLGLKNSYTWHKIEETDPEEMNSQLATWRFCRRRIPEHVRKALADLAFCNSQPLAVCVDDLIIAARAVGRWLAGGKA